jgi:hypothetical protein
MVRRGLERDVERDLHAERLGPADEGAKIVERAQTRLDGVVSTLVTADTVGHTGVIRSGLQGVVFPLPECAADRVDGSQVDDVETHVGDGRQPRPGLGEGGAPGRVGTC